MWFILGRFPWCPSPSPIYPSHLWVSMCDSINLMSSLVSDQRRWPGVSWHLPIPVLSLVASVPNALLLASEYLLISPMTDRPGHMGLHNWGSELLSIVITEPHADTDTECVTSLDTEKYCRKKSGEKNSQKKIDEKKQAEKNISWPGSPCHVEIQLWTADAYLPPGNIWLIETFLRPSIYLFKKNLG